jgi:hypothetical protein
MDRAPHYLRVVQALALVSGLGPVAIVVGAAVHGCGSSPHGAEGFLAGPEGGQAIDDAAFNGQGMGALDAVALPSPDGSDYADACGQGGICNDYDGSVAVDASDAESDVTTDGGPLPPPDLPV